MLPSIKAGDSLKVEPVQRVSSSSALWSLPRRPLSRQTPAGWDASPTTLQIPSGPFPTPHFQYRKNILLDVNESMESYPTGKTDQTDQAAE